MRRRRWWWTIFPRGRRQKIGKTNYIADLYEKFLEIDKASIKATCALKYRYRLNDNKVSSNRF